MSATIKSLNIGLPKELAFKEDQMITSVRKEQVLKAYLTKDGFEGDLVANKKYHGGPDRAVLMYSYNHYLVWNKEFDSTLQLPAFGENITVNGMTEQNVHIGDVYEIGEAIIQVTQGRIPCDTLSKNNDLPKLLKRLIETGYTGYLCRVIKEGTVFNNSNITLLERDPNSVSVLYTNHIYFHDKDNQGAIKKILNIEALADEWVKKLSKRLHKT